MEDVVTTYQFEDEDVVVKRTTQVSLPRLLVQLQLSVFREVFSFYLNHYLRL
jgi:hypothetical protein